MKKRICSALLAVLLALLCACGKSGGSGTTRPASSGAASSSSGSPNKEVAVTEQLSESGPIGDGQDARYSFHIPRIEDDTPDAAAINQELTDQYVWLAESSLELIRNKETPYCSVMEYWSHRCGDVLSLVVRCVYYYDAYTEYSIYNYDTARGVRLSNEDLLAIQGVTQEQAQDAICRAAVSCYDDDYLPLLSLPGDLLSPGDYREGRVLTLSSLVPDLPLYLDDEGVLHTIAPVGSQAGEDWTFRDLTLEPVQNSVSPEIDESIDYLTVTRRGGELTLCFHETPAGVAVMEGLELTGISVPYETELTVNGLYGTYTRIFCSSIGEMGACYVFLLTREGRVECVDVFSCLRAGCFCSSGPLPGVQNVTDFRTVCDENGFDVPCAITAEGESIQLGLSVLSWQSTLGGSLTGSWSRYNTVPAADGGSRDEFVSLELDSWGDFSLSRYYIDEDLMLEVSGCMVYLGMTEQGSVYAFQYREAPASSGPVQNGAAAFRTGLYYGTDELYHALFITELSGTPLLGGQSGDETILRWTVG